MSVRIAEVKKALRGFDFKTLFIEELRWDRTRAPSLSAKIAAEEFRLEPIAEKRGMVVFRVQTKSLPLRSVRAQIQRQVAKQIHEHIIIYTDSASSSQVWQWPKRRAGSAIQAREHAYHIDQDGEALIQKLHALLFNIEEEAGLTIATVADRARIAFDSDTVTKKFYDRFKQEHTAFLSFIEGMSEIADKEWYASLTLNRLMFTYFIQKKGFLNGERDYLQRRLEQNRRVQGANRFHSFFRYFLLKLFHEGLGATKRTTELEFLLGKVPYFNGGLFDVHELEEKYPRLDIADEAFGRVFRFFEEYSWHLDERPLRADNEINPDVLGFIFEKYINQKETGAYYTKEDVTSYICSTSIVPHLVRQLEGMHGGLLGSDGALVRILAAEPERYLPESLRHGIGRPVPSEITKAAAANNSRVLNQVAPVGHGLPSETWGEYLTRIELCRNRTSALRDGRLETVEELIANNINIAQALCDLLSETQDPALVANSWESLREISVLDPACGSGAFLFAALNCLEPIYMACLDTMQALAQERKAVVSRSDHQELFSRVIDELGRHVNKQYFVEKTIVLSNLYGTDLMKEAVEVCKLRLFLKLASNLSDAREIEPLPDLDFNMRSGNALVGFCSEEDFVRALTVELDGQQRLLSTKEKAAIARIAEEAEVADRAFALFRRMQTEFGMKSDEFAAAKADLRRRLDALRSTLDGTLAETYGCPPERPRKYAEWREAFRPFHWFIEFFGVMKQGGFSVIAGNPPWKEYAKVRNVYQVKDYRTERCGNLHAMFSERSLKIRHRLGVLSFIVQLPLTNSSRMREARQVLRENSGLLVSLPFDDRPGKLFEGLENCRSVIFASHGRTTTRSADCLPPDITAGRQEPGGICLIGFSSHQSRERRSLTAPFPSTRAMFMQRSLLVYTNRLTRLSGMLLAIARRGITSFIKRPHVTGSRQPWVFLTMRRTVESGLLRMDVIFTAPPRRRRR